MTICILGRQPAIALAELEAVYGANAVRRISPTIALVDASVDFARFGGLIKVAKLLTELPGSNPQKGIDYCRRALPEHLGYLPEGKLKLGMSLYDLQMPIHKLNANLLSLKKVVKQHGRSVRVIPNTELSLSSAQTMHNQLTSELGIELVLIRDGEQMLLGQVSAVQDINDYGRRDRGRPKRDARVGMLPPKLAQIIINLAVGAAAPGAASVADPEGSALPAERDKTANPLASSAPEGAAIEARTGQNITILDPFCGTGVIPQEALLRGYDVIGTDLEPRMIDYTEQNLAWLRGKYPITAEQKLAVGDATSHNWGEPISFVACEGFLGTPFSVVPSQEKLRETIHDSNTIMKKFLKNITPQLAPGARLCIGAPAWFTNSGIHHLPVLDDLENLGYNRIDFEHARREDLIYHRDDQIVGRELVVLVKE